MMVMIDDDNDRNDNNDHDDDDSFRTTLPSARPSLLPPLQLSPSDLSATFIPIVPFTTLGPSELRFG